MEKAYQKRRQALQMVLRESEVDYAVINNPTNIYYFSGTMYHTHERLAALLIAAQHDEAYMVLPTMEKGRLVDPQIQEVGFLDGEDSMGMLAAHIEAGSKLGIEYDYLHYGRAQALAQKSKCGDQSMFDIGQDIARLRLCKDAQEIALLQKACDLTDAMLKAWLPCVKVGAKESAMMFELIRLMAITEDAEHSFNAQVSSGVNTSIAHGIACEREVLPGEQVLIDFGVMYNSYHADITRTFFPSQPSAQLQEVYEVVLAANKAGIAAVKPGIPAKEVDLAARKVITDAGYGEYFTHRLGHGIGLDIHESPDIRHDNEMILEPGMTFTIEPGIYLSGVGGARVEDDVLVTESGSKILTNFPKEFNEICLF